MMMEVRDILVVNKLSKNFQSKGLLTKAVDNMSFSIKSGETFSIVGESGCGKSTTGRLILRLIDTDSGEINFNGIDILSLSKKELRQIRPELQMIFQDPYSSLNPRMSIRELLEEPIKMNTKLSSKEVKDKCSELISVVGLQIEDLDKYPHEFSGGQRQRISMARAISNNPKLIICDEPVSALDLLTQAQMLNLLKNLQKRYGFSYLFISHDLSVVKHISDRIGIMYKGTMVELGNRDDIFNSSKHPYTQLLLDSMLSLDSKDSLPELESIKDNIQREKSNCKFALRCPKFNEKCISNKIDLKELEKEHYVACSLYD